VLSDDIFKDPTEAGTVFIEINVAPGFRGHYYPTVGKKRELAPLILETILRKRKEH
jgi:D-alanine-D-alanine ligase-like ATP-grasp enzyme